MILKKSKISTIVGIVILLVGTFLGVFLINIKTIFRLGASDQSTPLDIRMSNISESTFTISWVTDKETSGFVLWGKSESKIDNIAKENNEKSFTHSVTLTDLSPQTNYFYKINSDGTLFDNKGIPWSTTTGPDIGINPDSILVSGSVMNALGEASQKSLVYANIGGYTLSTTTSKSGSFVFSLAYVRTPDLTSYAQINEKETLIEIFAESQLEETATAQVFPQSAKPIPGIVLGQTHDFRNLPPSTSGEVPQAILDLPSGSEEKSKFSIPDISATPISQENVTLKSLDDGEMVTSTEPEFFGNGPKGATLTISIESENPITDSVTVGQNGSWSWNPPENLAGGTHTVTITWKGLDGITRKLTKNFIVQAGEAPAFEASGSGATTTPTPSASASAKPTASPTTTASSAPVPDTGSLTPTIILFIMGAGVMTLSFATYKYAQSI